MRIINNYSSYQFVNSFIKHFIALKTICRKTKNYNFRRKKYYYFASLIKQNKTKQKHASQYRALRVSRFLAYQ